MAGGSINIRTSLGPVDSIFVIIAFLAGGFQGTLGSAVISALAAAIAIGVWRGVRLLGYLVEHAQADAGDEDDDGAC